MRSIWRASVTPSSGARPVGVMCAYNKTNGTYAAESRLLLDGYPAKGLGI